VTENHNGKQE